MAKKKRAQKETKASAKVDPKAQDETSAKEQRLPEGAELKKTLNNLERQHFEGLGAAWTAVTGLPAKNLIPQVIATVLTSGGTRPAWQWQNSKEEYVLMAWPKDQALRASVLMHGPLQGELKPISAVPLLEGLPNDLTVEQVHPWEHGGGANVGVSMLEEGKPLWFYDPFYERDKADLTVDVTHTFLLGALAFGVRRALLDEITIAKGPNYEEYAAAYLAEHPDLTSVDVPPLKIKINGQHFIYPGQAYGEYQLRCVVQEVEDCQLEKMPIKILYTQFPMPERPPLSVPIYVAKVNLGDFEPKVGDEIDAYVWFQGRVVDFDLDEQEEKAEA
ncbi:MAG: hypothetical protein IJS50_01070 [Desulfovibrio sp.]|nr:hypothetical protein [Desulfovibrio sp.]